MAIDIDDIDYQIKLITVILLQPDFLKNHREYLKPEWLDSKELSDILTAILSYYDQYHGIPEFSDLKLYLKKVITPRKRAAESVELLDGMSKFSDNNGLSAVADHFHEFISFKAYKAAILAGMRALEKRQYDIIPGLVREAEKVSASSFGGLEYFDDIYKRITTVIVRDTIPTGIKALDETLDGGTARKELTVVLAGHGVGKTTFLINLGYAAVSRGFFVVHFFVEQTQELVASRYDCRFTRTPLKEVQRLPKKMSSRIRKVGKKGGRLLICDCAAWTVEKLRSYIYRMCDTRVPDVIIIDYADKLAAAKNYHERRFEISSIYGEILAMGKEFNASVLTASQANRQALEKKDIRTFDLAEDIGKANDADTVLALCQTEQERKLDDMRIFTAKVRNVESHREISCKIFRNKMHVMSKRSFVKVKS